MSLKPKYIIVSVFLFSSTLTLANPFMDSMVNTQAGIYRGSGSGRDCSNIPSEIQQVAERMIELRQSCSPLQRRSSADRPIMVTDYSNREGNLYVFDEQGRCTRQLDTASWGHGGGAGSSGDPRHCSVGESNYSPAGLHLIVEKEPASDKYNSDNSYAMMELDNQGSLGRGILFHGNHPGTSASTQGCCGLSDTEFDELQETRPVDGLVYNYFGDTEKGSDCARSDGYRPNGEMPSCEIVSQNLNTNSNYHDPRRGQSTPSAN